jgi:hypothetical protein
MRGNWTFAAVAAAAGLAPVAHAAIFTGIASFRTAGTAVAPAGGSLNLTGPADNGFGSWFGNSTLNQSGVYAFASQGSELTSTSLSAVGETFAASAGTTRRVGARSAIDFIFTLDETAIVTVFAQAGGNFGSSTSMRVYLGTDTEAVINTTSTFVTFTDVTLAAGTYILSAEILTDLDGVAGSSNGFYNVSVSVPAPGAAAILALSGLVASRRRRAR